MRSVSLTKKNGPYNFVFYTSRKVVAIKFPQQAFQTLNTLTSIRLRVHTAAGFPRQKKKFSQRQFMGSCFKLFFYGHFKCFHFYVK